MLLRKATTLSRAGVEIVSFINIYFSILDLSLSSKSMPSLSSYSVSSSSMIMLSSSSFSRYDDLLQKIGKGVHELRSIGFTSMAENAYASSLFLLLKAKVHDLAGDDYRTSILGSMKIWIQTVPLQFLNTLSSFLGDSVSDGTTWSGLTSVQIQTFLNW